MQSACAYLSILSSLACLSLPYFFPTLSHKRHDFRKKGTYHKMCVSSLATTLFWNISRYENNSRTYYHKCIYVFMYSTLYFCRIWMRLIFSRQIFEKYWNVKFRENSSSENGVVPSGRTDGQRDRQTSLFAVLQRRQKTGRFLLRCHRNEFAKTWECVLRK
jgi:hypothetical protein